MKRAVLLLLICMSNGWLMANHWTPTHSGFEDNMTLTGIIQIDGVEQQSTTLEVGVFCGEECRGTGYPTYFSPMQRYVIQLLVFGGDGDSLTFKLYDSDLGQELDLVSPDAVSFNANGYGSLSNPYVLNFTENSFHWTPNESSYEENMTLIGIIQINGIEQFSTALEVGVFCGGECRGSGHLTYFPPTQRYVVQLLIFGEAGDQLTFRLYDSDLGQELGLISPDAVTFNANGYGLLADPYTLNFTGDVGESCFISTNVSPAVGGTVQGAGAYQQGQTCTLMATANEGCIFSNWTENGTVVSTNPVYAFSVTSNRTLIAHFTITGSNTHWNINESSYENNMTLTGVIQIDGVEQQSTALEVGVFCGEECRGTALPIYFFPTQRYIIQLLIFGESGDQLTFKLYDHDLGQELDLALSEPVAFNSNGSGTLTDPIVLNFTSNGFIPWVPNESSYEDNMTLTGVIQINGIEQQSTTLEVGVFCGEECRGTGLATYFFPTQRYVVQLTIFGETGDQLTFKLYDHALGQELNLTSPEAITFTANGYGTLGNPYVLNFTGEMPSAFRFITSGTWSTPSNWLGGVLPDSIDEVFIDAPCQLDQNATVAALTVTNGQSLTLQSEKTLTVSGNLTNTVATGLVIEDNAQLVHNVANVQATVKKLITPFNGTSDGWHLIALPLTGNSNVESVTNLLEGEYDLYGYDEATAYWRNQKHTERGFTALEATKGYLYANSAEVTLGFSGTLENGSATITVPLSYTDGANLSGFNLIGNPFPCNAYLNREYYILTTDGTDINPEPIPATTPIPPCTAVFVKAVAEGETVVFTRVSP